MGEAFILDTSAVIKYLKKTFPDKGLFYIDSVIDLDTSISVISRMELLGWKGNEHDYESAKIFVANVDIIPMTEAIILKTIEVRREYKLKLPDAIIASTALVLNRTLLADNDLDFLRVPNLKYINPRTIS